MSFRARKFREIGIRKNNQYFIILTLLSKFLFVKHKIPHQRNWKCRKNNQKRTFLGVEYIIRLFFFPTRFIAYTTHMVSHSLYIGSTRWRSLSLYVRFPDFDKLWFKSATYRKTFTFGRIPQINLSDKLNTLRLLRLLKLEAPIVYGL